MQTHFLIGNFINLTWMMAAQGMHHSLHCPIPFRIQWSMELSTIAWVSGAAEAAAPNESNG